MCFGTRPVYRVILATDGLVEHDGEAFVERIGQHQGEVDPERVDDLIRVIPRLGFAHVEPEYPTMVADQPSSELVLTTEQDRHSVMDHGVAPLEFWAMTATVDAGTQATGRSIGSVDSLLPMKAGAPVRLAKSDSQVRREPVLDDRGMLRAPPPPAKAR